MDLAVVVAAAGVAAAVGAAVGAAVAARGAARSERRVEALQEQVGRLAGELAAARQPPGFVITSVPDRPVPSRETATPTPAAAVLEAELVGRLARQQGVSALRDRLVDATVHALALGHGVRRALSADVRDRAVAEAHVARRRSRRDRRREERAARRLVRSARQDAA